MAIHPELPESPYAILNPDHRWFPAAEELREKSYEKLLPPLVAKVRAEVQAWRDAGYAGATDTSRALLRWWFGTEHLIEQANGSLASFRYYFAQREAVETVIWLYDVRRARDKFDLLRFDASGAVSAGMFPEEWPRYGRFAGRGHAQGFTQARLGGGPQAHPAYFRQRSCRHWTQGRLHPHPPAG